MTERGHACSLVASQFAGPVRLTVHESAEVALPAGLSGDASSLSTKPVEHLSPFVWARTQMQR
jgi:hypothetical protein